MEQSDNEEIKAIPCCSWDDCNRVVTIQCEYCPDTHYCSKEHQLKDWLIHKLLCNKDKLMCVFKLCGNDTLCNACMIWNCQHDNHKCKMEEPQWRDYTFNGLIPRYEPYSSEMKTRLDYYKPF